MFKTVLFAGIMSLGPAGPGTVASATMKDIIIFKVEGTSMVPTLQSGESILVDKTSYRFHLPAHGDIIVFKYPPDPSRTFLKRVIGY